MGINRFHVYRIAYLHVRLGYQLIELYCLAILVSTERFYVYGSGAKPHSARAVDSDTRFGFQQVLKYV
jgi:hypothetical protein